MEPWTLSRYHRPRLCVDRIDREPGGFVVALTAGNEVYRLACDSVDVAKRLQNELSELRSADAVLWQAVCSGKTTSHWRVLCSFLDARSLITDSVAHNEELQAKQAVSVINRVKEAAASVLANVTLEQRDRVQANAASCLRTISSSRAGVGVVEPDFFAAAKHENFFCGLLEVELSYMRRSAPAALCATALMLAEIAGEQLHDLETFNDRLEEEMGGLYSEHDLDAHLTLIVHCLTQSAGDDAMRFPIPALPEIGVVSGLEFMRRAELLTRDALASWGPNDYLSGITPLQDIRSPLVTGCYIEEYHVTRRFVEIIAPMLRKRLSSPLRALMFRYYSEELGHEEFEQATCESLGVTGAILDRAIPLPLHFAFVDALTEASDRDPIAFFSVVMVTEGMIGDASTVSDRLAEVGRDHSTFRRVSQRHDDLNEDLHHSSIARNVFQNIEVVADIKQKRAYEWLLFLLELNHRAWNGVAKFYGPQKSLLMHGFLGATWTPVS